MRLQCEIGTCSRHGTPEPDAIMLHLDGSCTVCVTAANALALRALLRLKPKGSKTHIEGPGGGPLPVVPLLLVHGGVHLVLRPEVHLSQGQHALARHHLPWEVRRRAEKACQWGAGLNCPGGYRMGYTPRVAPCRGRQPPPPGTSSRSKGSAAPSTSLWETAHGVPRGDHSNTLGTQPHIAYISIKCQLNSVRS